MSGGHFDYQQYKLNDIADAIEKLIAENGKPDEYDWVREYSPEVLEEFRNGIKALKHAAVYAQRIDWLVSGDDGPEEFHARLAEELKEVV